MRASAVVNCHLTLAVLSHEPCLGVWWISTRSAKRRASCAGKASEKLAAEWVLRSPPERRTRPDQVEQRPVAVLEHMALWMRGPRLQPQRPDDAIVTVIALQDDSR